LGERGRAKLVISREKEDRPIPRNKSLPEAGSIERKPLRGGDRVK